MFVGRHVEVQTEYLDYFTRGGGYLLENNQDHVKIQNLLQELSQERIYVKYTLPDGQYSHRNRMNYSFNEFFNILRKIRVMNFIIMFLVLMIIQQRMI